MEFGVRPGIAIAQAVELASRTGARPQVVQHDPVADLIALERIAEMLQDEISPLVAMESLGKRPWAGQWMLEPDTLFCDLSGITHLFGDEAGIMRSAHQLLGRCRVKAKLAIADNAAAAWAHAHYNPKRDLLSRSLVSDLESLPIEAIRIETETKHTLDRLGVQTIGGLLRLPRSGLAKRLGETLVRRIAEIIGEIDVPLRMHHVQPRYTAFDVLEYPTDAMEIINHRVGCLVENVVAALETHQRGALRLECCFELVDQQPRRTVVGLFAPTRDPEHLACLVESGIESLRLTTPITKITLNVTQSDAIRTQQNALFDETAFSIDGGSVARQSLSRLIDSLTSRLGRQAVLGVRSSDNPLPEKAYRTYSLTDHRTRKAIRRLPSKTRSSVKTTGLRSPSRHDSRRRPTKLLRKPIALPASASPGESLPKFRFENRVHRVARSWGPERIETGWWDGPTIRRDYFRVETESGDLWWIFRDIKSGEWFLHGRFA